MLLSIGDQVRPGTYRLHSVFERAVNYERRGRLISVVDETIGPGPLNIVLRRRSADFQSALRVGSSTVSFVDHRYPYTARHRYRSRLEMRAVDLPRLQNNLSVLGQVLKQAAPPKSLAFLLDGKRRQNFRAGFERAYAKQIERGVRRVFHSNLLEGIRLLKGCGLGLTPGGDDFIAGLLIGLHLLQKLRGRDFRLTRETVFRAARGNNMFSNTFLDLARRGLLFGRMKDLLLALLAGSEASVRKAAGKLFAVGETSSADLATGFYLTVRNPKDAPRLTRAAKKRLSGVKGR